MIKQIDPWQSLDEDCIQSTQNHPSVNHLVVQFYPFLSEVEGMDVVLVSATTKMRSMKEQELERREEESVMLELERCTFVGNSIH